MIEKDKKVRVYAIPAKTGGSRLRHRMVTGAVVATTQIFSKMERKSADANNTERE